MRRWSEAEQLCARAGSIWAIHFTPDHLFRRYNDNLLGGIFAGLGRFSEAERLLTKSYETLRSDIGRMSPNEKRATLERFIRLYDSWDAAKPGKGYAEKAAERRTKLEETSKSQDAETPK